MESKPLHYDGSIQNSEAYEASSPNETFVLTEEMRMNISGNPYVLEKSE
ncbi:hypothetical protein IMZ08_04135 [Bacillus luteolus]|uniref:Uncharacterized protein n=1 Tax=Litchfieldia luteola TaxID=682179 RepID=A0ABR9QFI8_9BACI|nr:hypothetical protein [Cytobacillus luteolus]MBE4907248.1 hypothetical protein [Cytobacillus luteolus]MBP1943275.1 hypothetical protein [Cytobacillus luteolus]